MVFWLSKISDIAIVTVLVYFSVATAAGYPPEEKAVIKFLLIPVTIKILLFSYRSEALLKESHEREEELKAKLGEVTARLDILGSEQGRALDHMLTQGSMEAEGKHFVHPLRFLPRTQ